VPKNKHRKFSEINTFANVVQPECRFPVIDHPFKGQWGQKFFNNNNPIILEVGCGKGEYTIGLAKAYPDHNFIGIDIKGNRLWTGARYALENAMSNVGFLRIQAEHLNSFFGADEISGIWVTFPDPQPNKPRVRKRLTSPAFLDLYRNFLKLHAPVYLKTDNQPLYDYTLEVIEDDKHLLQQATNDLYGNPGDIDPLVLSIQTYYEKIYLSKGKSICFINFSLVNSVAQKFVSLETVNAQS
jgi:tRNA (guanine-N7-)-methyltransferase